MARKELKSVMERVNEIRGKAKNEESPTTEVSENIDATSWIIQDQQVVGKVEFANVHTDLEGKVFLSPKDKTIEDLKETTSQNTVRIMQELQELKDSIQTIESVLTKLVIQASTKAPQKNGKSETPKEMESYEGAVDEVRVGLELASKKGVTRFKFDGNGPNILAILLKKGFSIPNAEEFKNVLKTTKGLIYNQIDNTFSLEDEG